MKTKLTYLILMVAAISIFSCKKDEEKPKLAPTVTTGQATNITTTSATVAGALTNDGNVTVTKTGIVYSSNVAQPTIADNNVELTDIEGEFTAAITGLTSGTTYHVRAFATNAVGTGYGDVVDFTTGNLAPTASNIVISGTTVVAKTLTATYTYTDAENNAQGASAFKWYRADNATGGGEVAIAGATALTYTLVEADQSKYIRFGVTPKAATGTTDGIEVKSSFIGAVGEQTTVTFTYNGEEVTYGIITSTATQRKWLDRNLGAGRAPTSASDHQAYGHYFQWGRPADGHQVVTRTGPNDADATGVNGITSTASPYETSSTDAPTTNKFIIDGGLNGDWRDPQSDNLWQGISGVNNPCPAGWRLPTQQEIVNENITTVADGYSKLKVTYTGFRSVSTGAFSVSVGFGYLWTSTTNSISTPSFSYRARFNDTGFAAATTNRGNAYPIRCIKN